MKVQNLFYTIGIIFLFSAIGYFAKEFLLNLSAPVKLMIFILLIIIFFVLGEVFEEKDW